MLGALFFSIYTMELYEKERNINIRGCNPFVVTKRKAPRSYQGHPGSKARLGPRAPCSPHLSTAHEREPVVNYTTILLHGTSAKDDYHPISACSVPGIMHTFRSIIPSVMD